MPGPLPKHLLIAAALVGAALPATARASDLLILQGSPAEVISGSVAYDHVFVDGTLRLAGDTQITAADVVIGPNAFLSTCYVPGVGDNGCTSGRSLTIHASGPIGISQGISLQGGQGNARPGGNLDLAGSRVFVGGDISTSGIGLAGQRAPSGAVAISSPGTVSVRSVFAPGAPVTIAGAGGVTVGGDLVVGAGGQQPLVAPDRAPGGGGVAVASSAGDVTVNGRVSAAGLDSSGAIGGGPGGSATLTGGDVRVGAVDVSGGGSQSVSGGPAGALKVAARGAATIAGDVDASGSGSSGSAASGGGQVTLSAGGLVATGNITVDGAGGAAGGGPGGTIDVTGGGAALGSLRAAGGSGNGAGSAAGPGGSVRVQAGGAATVGPVVVDGGAAGNGTAVGAPGGAVNVSGSSVKADRVSVTGGSSGGAGANGGSVRLWADGNLSVAGAVTTGGTAAGFGSPAGSPGGAGGPVLLRAGTGTLAVGGLMTAGGGDGGPGAGPAGAGAPIDLVASSVDSILGIDTTGGDARTGPPTGRGGDGGRVRLWSDSPFFRSGSLISTFGGDGQPIGLNAPQVQESSPSGLTLSPSGTFALTSRSPDAEGYRILQSVGGGPASVVAQTSATSGIATPPAPLCQPVTYTAVAFQSSLGWLSSPSNAVAATRQPSARQSCTDAPKVALGRLKPKTSRVLLARRRWHVRPLITSDGAGKVTVALLLGKKTVASQSLDFAQDGGRLADLVLPRRSRKALGLTVLATAAAPMGKATTTAKKSFKITTLVRHARGSHTKGKRARHPVQGKPKGRTRR